MGCKDLDCNLILCKLEKERGESAASNIALSANSSWVNAGMRDRCTRASMSKATARQTTDERFCQGEIKLDSDLINVALSRISLEENSKSPYIWGELGEQRVLE